MKTKFFIFFSVFSLFFASVACRRESDHVGFVHGEGAVWNTVWHVTYRGPESLLDSVTATLASVGASLNVFDPSSLVARVNAADSVPVNSDFIRVYTMARQVNEVSHGAFDPTLAPLIKAWGFGPGHQATPDTTRIDSLLALTGINRTRLANDMLIKEDPRISFNFSAIAKGYGCDRVGEMLRRNGVKDFLVEIGGEIAASGHSPSGDKWRVSVDKPLVSDSVVHESQVVVEFTDRGMATSGNYRNFHRDASGIYGHTISSVTGRPVRTDVLSATVIARTSMEADALATAFMAMGSKDALSLARSLRLPVLLILPDTTLSTPQFNTLIYGK